MKVGKLFRVTNDRADGAYVYGWPQGPDWMKDPGKVFKRAEVFMIVDKIDVNWPDCPTLDVALFGDELFILHSEWLRGAERVSKK